MLIAARTHKQELAKKESLCRPIKLFLVFQVIFIALYPFRMTNKVKTILFLSIYQVLEMNLHLNILIS